MLRTYARFASPLVGAATSERGDGVIGAKDRPSDLSGASDQDIVAWAKQGHEAAFRELVRRYERHVFSLIYRMVRNRALAEDLAQETFIKVLNGIRSYTPQFKFSSWIFKIANNAAIDHLRRRDLDTLSLDGSPYAATPEEAHATALQLGDRAETPLEEVEARELGGAIDRAIAKLRPEYRACILLRHVEGYAYEEIAQILDLRLATGKPIIQEGRTDCDALLRTRRGGNPPPHPPHERPANPPPPAPPPGARGPARRRARRAAPPPGPRPWPRPRAPPGPAGMWETSVRRRPT